ncbi:hypothetical protein J7E69_00375 [Rhodococcus enclensis]|nr:hypothetical protein [Rhodococcus qingshengii]MBT2269952.1 hypothetical protein [Rhodococcus qingshengii]
MRAYRLQETGHDTVSANIALGLPVDSREFSSAAQMLKVLNAQRIRLITNNPDKITALTRLGVEVSDRIALPPIVQPENAAYLDTKGISWATFSNSAATNTCRGCRSFAGRNRMSNSPFHLPVRSRSAIVILA